MNKKTILKFNSTKSVRPFAWLALAILAVGAFGNSVQAQWVNENFNTLGAGVAPTATLPLVKNGDGFALGVLPSGGALQINTTGTLLASETRWSLSDATFSTPRTSGYFSFKIKQNANINAVAGNFINFRLGAANANSLTTSANNWLEVRFIQSASSNIKVATQSSNLKTTDISSTTQVPIQIWYNQSGSPINYTRPDTGASTSLASGTFAVFANNVAILAPGTFPAGVTSAGTDTTPIGKFAFTVATSTKIDFTIDDLYAAASAPATTSAPTLTTNPIPITAQAGTTVNHTISYGGNPTPGFTATTTGGTWPSWATLSSSGTATFTPLSSQTPASYTLTFKGENSEGSINGTFNVNVTAAATTPPTITSPSTPVVAKYLSSYTPPAIPLYTLTSTGDEPITYTAANLPAGLSLSGATIIGSATTLGQSVSVTLTAVNPAGSSTPITLPIKVVNYSWNGTGTDWTQVSSWNYDGVPATSAPVFSSIANTGDVAVLGSGGSTVVVPDIGSSIAGLLFNADSPAYQFSGGTLTVGNNASIVNQSTSEITFANKVANNGGNATWSSVAGGSIVLGSGFDCTGSDSGSSRTVTLGGAGNFTVGGPIGNGGNVSTAVGTVAVTSTGTTLFNAANTYSGATTVGTGANLKLGNVAALGNTTGATTVSGTLDLFGFSPALERFTLSGGSIVNSSSTPVTIDGTVALTGTGNTINASSAEMTISGVISSSGSFAKNGANTLTLTGVNTFTGGFTLNAGTVIGNSESPFGNYNGSYFVNLSGGNLIVQNPAALGYGANGSGNLASRPKVNLGGGTLTAQADLTLNAKSGESGQVTISAPSTISVDNNRTVRIEKMIATDNVTAANSVLTKTGLGTLTIIGNAETVIGGYMVNEGTLAFNGSSNAGVGAGPIVMNGGSLWVSKGIGSKNQYSGFNIPSLLSLRQNTVNYFEPNVNSPAGYNVMSLGALNLNGYKLTYMRTSTAPFVSVPQTDPVVTFRSATLNSGANELENNTSVVLVLQGASGTGGLTKTGTGTLVLSDQPNQGSANAILTSGVVTSVGLGDNPLKGFTEIPTVTIAPPINSDGTPVVGGTRATATATIDSNGVITAFTMTSNGSGYLSSPQVTVTPNNAVTVNTYNGATSVQGGKLNLSGSSSSSISLARGTTLELNYQAPSEATASLDNNVSTMPLKGIALVKSFAGYTVPPAVTIGAPQNLDGSLIANGVAATATAQVANGRIVGLTITSPGSGYLLTQRPNVTIAPPDQETVVATTTGTLSFAEGSRVRVTMSSAPVAGRSYTLVTAGSITGTPVLESLTVNGVDTQGYTLGVNGNNLELQVDTRTTPTITVTPAVGGYIYSASYQGPGVSEVNKGGSTGGVTLSYAGTGSTTYAASSTPPTSAGTYTVTATVAADSTYTQASSVPTAFTIVKATPTVSVAPTASAVTVGAVLSTSTLSGGTATVAGTFAWTTPSTVVSATSSYPVTFTPTDGANYNTASSAASVTANPAGTTYSSWLNGNGASDAAFLDYVFGAVTAGTLDASLKPAVAVTGGNLVLTYNVRQGTVGLSVTAQTSADLATGAAGWGTSGVTDVAVGTPRTVNGVSVQQRTASVSVSGGKKFLRIQAVQAAP
jgi:autotransporter-associated beta strand protein